MGKLSELPGQAVDLISQVGANIKDHVPDKALKWVETGAALGAVKTGARTATKLVRRNPAVAIAVAAGAGLLWYAARRRAKQVREGQDDAIEGSARRIEATPASPSARRVRRAVNNRGGRAPRVRSETVTGDEQPSG